MEEAKDIGNFMRKSTNRGGRRAFQTALPGFSGIEDAVDMLAGADPGERGAVFTKREVVEFILDLVGYTVDAKLSEKRILEPSFGEGDFLLIIVERLLESCARNRLTNTGVIDGLKKCIRAVELHKTTCAATREKLEGMLENAGCKYEDATSLLNAWLVRGDFLLIDLPFDFSHIVGNPPYIRHELIPDALMAEYRKRFHTIYDRADIYIPFIEKSLQHLSPDGALGFICSDRWMKNRYGGPLRRMVAERFHLNYYVDMVDTPAFHSDVIAYPAITVITREKPGATHVARRPRIDRPSLSALAGAMTSGRNMSKLDVRKIPRVTLDDAPWILDAPRQLAVARGLEETFPKIEDAGCKVGIGVATGADKVFIGTYEEMDVEPDRKLPLAMTRDILNGFVEWCGHGVVNPFKAGGGLVDLKDYPRLAAWFEPHEKQLRSRHVARRNQRGWYRTIDRIYPEIATRPKLLIPDIKGDAHVVYEGGRLYPHHNLYFITSEEWDLKALQAVLLSGIARLFVSIYSTKMRGGYLRFQAQYLRRIRIPSWSEVPDSVKSELVTAAEQGDAEACNAATFKLYGLSSKERAVVMGEKG